jgi:hypothetical protein|tara:strand:- start:611 stop:1210 length:600 start_codon:yes stop_codon:yes gene_type:complete
MTSGIRAKSLYIVATLVVSNIAGAHDDENFRVLMEAFAGVDESRVAYSEIKSLGILESTLEQSGILIYSASETVIREIRKPVVETYAIIGDTVQIMKGGEEERIDLNAVPLLMAFIESFRATLSGNIKRLGEHYHLDFTRNGTNWKLSLRPRNPELAVFVDSIVFTGRYTRIEEILISETGGDWSRMSLAPIVEAGDDP